MIDRLKFRFGFGRFGSGFFLVVDKVVFVKAVKRAAEMIGQTRIVRVVLCGGHQLAIVHDFFKYFGIGFEFFLFFFLRFRLRRFFGRFRYDGSGRFNRLVGVKIEYIAAKPLGTIRSPFHGVVIGKRFLTVIHRDGGKGGMRSFNIGGVCDDYRFGSGILGKIDPIKFVFGNRTVIAIGMGRNCSRLFRRQGRGLV